MTNKQLKKEFEKIAQSKLGIQTLEYRNRDGLDFYDNDDGSISVGGIQDALQAAYELGLKAGKKEASKVTKIELAFNLGTVEIGKKVTIYGKEYTVVGISGNETLFACLKPETLDDAIVIQLSDAEIEEFIECGDMKGYDLASKSRK